MNLMKIFRKNNKKIMAVVVVILMVAFLMPTSLRQLNQLTGGGTGKAMAHYGGTNKITSSDRSLAMRELDILMGLRAHYMLKGLNLPGFRNTLDLRPLLLGELLFSERSTSAMVSARIKQQVAANEYQISEKQINDIYRGTESRDVYWLLLTKEAEQAGIKVSRDDAGNTLAKVIPQLFADSGNPTYSQVIGSMMSQQKVPEEEILNTFAKLLAVMEYAKASCSNEAITSTQIMHDTSIDNESIGIEYVKFDTNLFAKDAAVPSEEQIEEHFNKYKGAYAGEISTDNPHGFGYKLAERVQLDYMAVKLDDVKATVTAPTPEEAEEFYQKHKEQFVEKKPSDANDPNSLPVERTKSYAEVANDITRELLKNKVNSKAEKMLAEAKDATETGFVNSSIEFEKLTEEQIKELAGDYNKAAEEISKKYNIKIYAGQTGLLSAEAIQSDKYLGRLYAKGSGYNPVGLTRIVFAIEKIGSSELGPFDTAKPKMHENIGPLRDASDELMVMARVVKAEKSSEPENVDVSFNVNTINLGESQENVFSIKEKVTKDIQKLAAMDTTKAKAEEFVKTIAKSGWESAIEELNKLHSDSNSVKETEKFKLQNIPSVRRLSKMRLETIGKISEGNPASRFLINESNKESLLIDKLYSLVSQDANTLSTVPYILPFEADMSYYVIKSLSVKHLNQAEYEGLKNFEDFKTGTIQSQSLAAVHFNPENILKRNDFKWSKEYEQGTIPAPVESEDYEI